MNNRQGERNITYNNQEFVESHDRLCFFEEYFRLMALKDSDQRKGCTDVHFRHSGG